MIKYSYFIVGPVCAFAAVLQCVYQCAFHWTFLGTKLWFLKNKTGCTISKTYTATTEWADIIRQGLVSTTQKRPVSPQQR